MSRIVILCLVLSTFQHNLGAQSERHSEIAGVKRIARDVHNNPVPVTRHGNSIWNNRANTAWWSGPDTNYLNLDWGILPDQGNGLPDEVVDGFTFFYGTNNVDPAGETFSIHFYDSCTGRGNQGIQEAGFTFAGLPNGSTFGTICPGWGHIVSVSVDLENSGYEFLLGREIGIGYIRRSTPTMGRTGLSIGDPGLKGGNGYTGTRDMFDTYYPNGFYENSWWFGGGYPCNPWATFSMELFGGRDPGNAMTYGGIGAQGNDAALYSIGDWVSGSRVQFLMRKNGIALPGWLLASIRPGSIHFPDQDVTFLLGLPLMARRPMTPTPDPVGDFDRSFLDIGPVLSGMRLYFQGAIMADGAGVALTPATEVDLSNGIRSN